MFSPPFLCFFAFPSSFSFLSDLSALSLLLHSNGLCFPLFVAVLLMMMWRALFLFLLPFWLISSRNPSLFLLLVTLLLHHPQHHHRRWKKTKPLHPPPPLLLSQGSFIVLARGKERDRLRDRENHSQSITSSLFSPHGFNNSHSANVNSAVYLNAHGSIQNSPLCVHVVSAT